MLQIGDIWKEGRLWQSPDYEIANFKQLVVGRDTSTLIKAGLPDEATGQYYLPVDVHPYHMKFTQSYCAHVEAEDCKIVIPCAELLRFYFGSSSTLVSRLFDAPFRDENFWIGKQESDAAGLAKLQLAPGISGRSATDVGRIAFSTMGRAAAELVGNSCVVATVQGEAAYVKAVFPFNGRTDLSASGIWIPMMGKERGTFLVFRLRSCSHPFPFSELKYTSERAPVRPAHSSKSAAEQAANPSVILARRRQDAKVLSNVEPDRTKRSRGLGLHLGGIQFPDLARKPVLRIDSEAPPTVKISQHGVSIIDTSSVGGEGGPAPFQPIELSVTDATRLLNDGTLVGPKSRFALILLQVLQRIGQDLNVLSVDIIRLSQRQRFDYLSTMPQIVDENGEYSASCLVMESTAGKSGMVNTRNRKISVGRALELHRTSYFLIPEPDSDDSIELHVILDCSKSIRTTEDILAVIAMHFSTSAQYGEKLVLGEGLTSNKFFAISAKDSSSEAVSNELRLQALHFLGDSAAPISIARTNRPADVPDYLR